MPSEQLRLCGQGGRNVLWESAGLPPLGLPGNGAVLGPWAAGECVTAGSSTRLDPARLRARRRPS